jgi:serine/threonine-protein kinase
MGVIAFRALTGVKPFPAEQLFDAIVQIRTAEPPTPSALVAGLGPDIDAFFRRALERDVTKRFQSAKDFARALRALAPRDASVPPEVATSADRSSGVLPLPASLADPTEVSSTAAASTTRSLSLFLAATAASKKRTMLAIAAAGVGLGCLVFLIVLVSRPTSSTTPGTPASEGTTDPGPAAPVVDTPKPPTPEVAHPPAIPTPEPLPVPPSTSTAGSGSMATSTATASSSPPPRAPPTSRPQPRPTETVSKRPKHDLGY